MDRIIWKTEGPTDLLSLVSLGLPEGHVARCNVFGSTETPDDLDQFSGAIVYVVHDCDEPGQAGALEVKNGKKTRPGWAKAIAAVAKEVRNVVLPYPIAESHGKDLRDWIRERLAEGMERPEVYRKLLELAQSMPVIARDPEIDMESLNGVIEEIDDPHRLAKINLEKYRKTFERDLKYWNESWYAWKSGTYEEITKDHLETRINMSIKEEFDRAWKEEYREYEKWKNSREYDKSKDRGPPKARKVVAQLVKNVYDATKALCWVSSTQKMHNWIGKDHPDGTFVCVKNGILNLKKLLDRDYSTMDDILIPHSPNWFSTSMLPYQFDPGADCKEWKKFLESSFGGDRESILALQQWFGYLLTPEDFLQKILFVIGQPRSGKGTIIHVMREVLGKANIATPTLSELGQQYGLNGLLGKTVGIIADARMSDRMDETLITERLLSISGADPQNIQRKYKSTLVGHDISVRFTLFSNLLPKLKDASAAFITRCIFLSMPNSFVDREDEGLRSRLMLELPGILNWSIAGRYILNQKKKIEQPKSGIKLLKELKSIMSPVLQFLEACCEYDQAAETPTKEVFSAWEAWCEENDVSNPGCVQSFSRRVKAIRPNVDTIQKRESMTNRRTRCFLGLRLSDAS